MKAIYNCTTQAVVVSQSGLGAALSRSHPRETYNPNAKVCKGSFKDPLLAPPSHQTASPKPPYRKPGAVIAIYYSDRIIAFSPRF